MLWRAACIYSRHFFFLSGLKVPWRQEPAAETCAGTERAAHCSQEDCSQSLVLQSSCTLSAYPTQFGPLDLCQTLWSLFSVGHLSSCLRWLSQGVGTDPTAWRFCVHSSLSWPTLPWGCYTNALLEDGTGICSSNISTLCFQTVPVEARMKAVEKINYSYGSNTGIMQMCMSWSAKITRAHYCVLLLSAHSHLWCELAPVLSEHTAFPQLLPHPFQTYHFQSAIR